MFGEKYIENLDWKEKAMANVIAWRQEIEALETKSKIDFPKSLKKEIESLFRSLPVIDLSESHLINLFKVKYQLFAGKFQQFLKENSANMGKNKNKYKQNRGEQNYFGMKKGYTAPKSYEEWHGGPMGVPSSIQEREFNRQRSGEIKYEREEREVQIGVPEIRKEFKPGHQYQKIKETKCSFSKFEPEVVLTRLAFNKITAWCRMMNEEITALGVVEQEGEDFIIKDFFLFHQNVTQTTCEATGPEALIEVMEEAEKQGYDSSKLRCWWHSHNTMGTTPSQQDLKTAEEFAGKSFLISLINNHRGEFNCKINLYYPFEMEIADVPLFIQDEGISEEFIQERKKEIEKFVKTRSYRQVYHGFGTSVPLITDDMGLSDHLMGTSILNEQEDSFVDYEVLKDRVRKGDPLYEACMYENSVRYTWDNTTKRYKMYDGQNNELSSEDLKELGVYDYNEEIEEIIKEIENDAKKVVSTQEGA